VGGIDLSHEKGLTKGGRMPNGLIERKGIKKGIAKSVA
jgi:hypothetical protein